MHVEAGIVAMDLNGTRCLEGTVIHREHARDVDDGALDHAVVEVGSAVDVEWESSGTGEEYVNGFRADRGSRRDGR